MYYRVDLEHVTDSHIEIESWNTRKTKASAYKLAERLSNSELFHQLDGSNNIRGNKGFARVWIQQLWEDGIDDDYICGPSLQAEFKYGKKTYETIG